MKLLNSDGQAVYYNIVEKRGKLKYIVLAASGQRLVGRDKQKLKSRSFLNEHSAEAFLKRHGYTVRT